MSESPGSPPPFGNVPPPPGSTPLPPGQPQFPPPPGQFDAPPPGYQPYAGQGYPPYQPQFGNNPATQFGQLAGFGTRFGGFLLDQLLYGLLFAVGLIPAIVLIVSAYDECVTIGDEIVCGNEIDGRSFGLGVVIVLAWLVVVVVVYLRALATTGQTWGRRIVGIKVINETTGEAPGWGKAIGRSAFASFISAQILYIGYLWMIWDDKKQTLHDKVAGTHVIST